MLSLLLTLIVQLAFQSEAGPIARPAAGTPAGDGWSAPVQVTGMIDGVRATHALLMYLPSGYSARAAGRYPLIVALHGWNHSAELFKDNGDLGRWADRYGVVLAVPDMGKTIYETALYEQTKPAGRWSTVPGTRWVAEVILPYVRAHYAVHGDRAHTGVLGYSTGGRGAVLLAEAYPEFVFAGSTSGTFDLMRLEPREGEYRIHALVLGERDAFPERWQLDNVVAPERLAKLAGVRLYIAHGARDRAVKPDQVDALRDALSGREVRDIRASYQIVGGGKHDWKLWTSQWGPMFAAAAEAFGVPAPR